MPKRRGKKCKAIPKGNNLVESLANATPGEKRTILGEALYPLVKKLEPSAAAKVTGMLLEFDQNEVLWLLESPFALKSVVAVAMEILRTVPLKPLEANIAGGIARGTTGSLTSHGPISIETLALVLANMAPEKLKPVLGEFLYPLVEKQEPEESRKVTGMLLDLDHTQILHLLQFPEALKSKVAEAMEVLRSFAPQKQPRAQQHPVADELGFIEFD